MGIVNIGKIRIEDPLILAPMAGTTTLAFRSICHGFGSSYQPTELVSARSILYSGIDKSYCYLMIDREAEGITCIQLFGNEPSDFEYAIGRICEDERLSFVDIIDINMGCPVQKVVKTGAGSALMRDPVLAEKILKASLKVCDSYGKELTVKTRIGYDAEDSRNGKAEDFIRRISQTGVKAVAVHGRTRDQMYHGNADIDALQRMKKASEDGNIPFIANGDIKDTESARKMLSQTGADGLMIGRAAQGNPWIFKELKDVYKEKDGICVKITFEERKEMLLRELSLTMKYKDENIAVREMRPSMMAYIKGMPGASELKVKLCSALTYDEVKEIL